MVQPELGPESDQALEQVLGYLNFSSGAPDPQFLANLNRLYAALGKEDRPAYLAIGDALRAKLNQLIESDSAAFRDSRQVRRGLSLAYEFLPRYWAFHQDLLFHQTESELWGPFAIGRVFEVLLQQTPWEDKDDEQVISSGITLINNFLGYRPVATLESQRIEPYGHEWVAPIPLFVRGAGVAVGPCQQVIESAIRLLEETDEDLLRAACFDPSLMDEMSVDPRTYDFDHPVNKRPNYHFGLWDTHRIDNQGRYRRFIVQQVTLDSLMARLDSDDRAPEEMLFDGAAVLAGTVLMASAISGRGPNTHDSNTTLAVLLPAIAQMRDEFYERLIKRTEGDHGQRLAAEAKRLRQPFGGARQHLNAQLARRRATQLEHVHLAKIFSRMGYSESASRQIDVVPVASARMLCELDCMLTNADGAIEKGQWEEAIKAPSAAVDILRRGIECGAIVDPWNILGFDAHFSLFPATENAVHDHRIDELASVIDRIFAMMSRLWSEAAARDNHELCEKVDSQFQQFVDWWRKYAAHEVESVDCPDPAYVYRAAQHVARALNLWHKGGAASGDVAFWAPHADMFDSPKAYTLVVEALLQRRDFVASMALLNHWLGQSESVPLEQGECSFHELTERWLEQYHAEIGEANGIDQASGDGGPAESKTSDQYWPLLRKFFDHLEANAEEYWRAPRFQVSSARRNGNGSDSPSNGDDAFDEEVEDEGDDLFSAAYEDVVFRDSTDDGVEGEIFDSGPENGDELTYESNRVAQHLLFLSNVSRLWKMIAVDHRWNSAGDSAAEILEDRRNALLRWIQQAVGNRDELLALLDDVRSYGIPIGTGDHESMVEYDRQRLLKESLLERVITTCVETTDAIRLLMAAVRSLGGEATLEELCELLGSSDDDQLNCVAAIAAVFQRQPEKIRESIPGLLESLNSRELLYVPLSKGGDPKTIFAARMRQRIIHDLLVWLPRSGLVVEAFQLIEAAREMERTCPVGPGAVTEFDELFAAGCRSMVEALVRSSQGDQKRLVDLFEKLTESLLICWLAHSRTLRLSVLEKVSSKRDWRRLVDFIQAYGDELFTQRFLNLGNVRAILHQGADSWLKQLEANGGPDAELRMLEQLDQEVSRSTAVSQLSLVLEAIIENYGEYRDYNSTTTQSDRGELLYMLLDFLRLRTHYDRVAWNLKPVVLAHEVLVRNGLEEAAAIWRNALTEKVDDEAELQLSRLARLQRKYAMRMPTVADRLGERFVKPLNIDSLRALVNPAMQELKEDGPCASFERLERETEKLTRDPTGVGLDPPPWLLALEDEVDAICRPNLYTEHDIAHHAQFPAVVLGNEELLSQLDRCAEICVPDPVVDPDEEEDEGEGK